MARVLIIGGYRDGEWIEDLGPESVGEQPPTTEPEPEYDYYNREVIRVNGRRFAFYYHIDLSREEAWTRLFGGYLRVGRAVAGKIRLNRSARCGIG